MTNHLHCYSQVDGSAIDYERFPSMRNPHLLQCALAPGEWLFVPIGWWHYVEGRITNYDVGGMLAVLNHGVQAFASKRRHPVIYDPRRDRLSVQCSFLGGRCVEEHLGKQAARNVT
ncbi:cupin-like domain-containing protein [Paraburkholderia fynbosensis]|uniref:Cupin-like domain-containing protein n=1 Tax=Paraburkholderia fynbosensis TaxID=1200993 RepID=A0A6J5G6H9_9BURK|nr:cupin-like domain-containing protein [Paraburkholderia fynbosensis]CAB3790842.1 hypothetical protein LMG27177_02922 [Paraburkholderia fynbosensis]